MRKCYINVTISHLLTYSTAHSLLAWRGTKFSDQKQVSLCTHNRRQKLKYITLGVDSLPHRSERPLSTMQLSSCFLFLSRCSKQSKTMKITTSTEQMYMIALVCINDREISLKRHQGQALKAFKL